MTPLDILSQLIRIPSVNPMGGDVQQDICYEHRLSDWLTHYFESIGAAHERIEVHSGRDNVLARYQAGPARPTILLDAHQDTVPVTGMSQPFDPQIRDGRVRGRGACDVKGSMAAMLHALGRLINDQPTDAANVVLSCSCDEEAGMGGVLQLVKYWEQHNSKSQLLHSKPDACIVAEPTDLNVVRSHLGVMRFRVWTTGQACHASQPDQGKNAIYAMTPVIGLLAEEAEQLATRSQGRSSCGRATLNVGIIKGGSSVNIVPDECVVEVDRRLVPGEDPAQIWTQINHQISKLPAARCDQPWLAAPALSDTDNGALADEFIAAVRSAGICDSEQIEVTYCTNGSTIAAAGVPTVVFGPGSIAEAHTAQESIEIKQLDLAADAYYRFCAGAGAIKS